MDNTCQQTNSSILSFTIGDTDFKMIKVEGGSLWMGFQNKNQDDEYEDDKDDKDSRYDDEAPVHYVAVDGFYLGETEVSQKLWSAVMGNNPSQHTDPQCDLPVENVSWYDCQIFIEKLNKLTGMSFRLPTEAEWEFAARGGTQGHNYRYRYAGGNKLSDVAWTTDDQGNKTHEIKTKKPNELGLDDMTGNVWEWCEDWYGSYDTSKPQKTKRKVLRGGGWTNVAKTFRIIYRESAFPDCRYYCIGFRLALSETV